MPENEEVVLKFRAEGVDQVKVASGALTDYRSQLKGTKEEEDKLANGSTNLSIKFNEVTGAIENIDFPDFKGVRDGLKGAATDADGLTESLKQSREELDELSKVKAPNLSGGDSSGDVGSASLRRTGGALSQIGLTDAGRGLQFAGDIQQLEKFKGEIGSIPPTMAAAGVAVIGLTAVVDIYAHQTQLAKEAAQAEITARESAIQLIATGTKEQQQAKLNELEATRKGNQAIADDTNKLYAELVKGINDKLGLAAAGIELNLAKIGKADGTFQAAYDAAEKANKAVGDTSTEMNILSQATGLTAQTTEEAAAAQLRYNDALKLGAEIIQGIETPLQKAKEVNDFLAKATTQQLQDKRQAAQADLDLTTTEIVQLTLKKNKLDESTQAYKDVSAEIDKLNNTEFGQLNTVVLLNDATAAATAAENDLKEVRKQQVADTQKYSESSLKNSETLSKGLIDAENKRSTALTNLAEQSALAAENLVLKLQEKLTDIGTSLAQNESDSLKKAQYQQMDDLLAYQREGAKEKRSYYETLAKLDRDYTAKSQGLVLDRDFAGLYALQQDRTRQKNEATITYNSQQAERLQAFKDQENDLSEHLRREYESEQTQAARQYAAQLLQYQRDQQALDKSTRLATATIEKSLTDQQNALQQAYANQQTLLNTNITQTLKQDATGYAGRLQAEADYYAESQKLIQGIYGTTGSGTAGSALAAGVSSAGALDIPQSPGGSSSSSVSTNNSKQVTVHYSQNITGGADSKAIAKAAGDAARAVIIDLIGAA